LASDLVRSRVDVIVAVQTPAANYVGVIPTTWSAGQTRSYSLKITNTGTATWNLTGTNPVHLGIAFGGEDDEPGSGGIEPERFFLTTSNGLVSPGQSVTLSISLTAPLTPGQYVLRHRMVKENVAWFESFLRTDVTVGG